MVSIDTFVKMALSFPGTAQQPHFERIGFKVIGKKMFATCLPSEITANIFLTSTEQRLFCKIDTENIYPVPNKWGEKGATTFVLQHLPEEIVMEALISAYQNVVAVKK